MFRFFSNDSIDLATLVIFWRLLVTLCNFSGEGIFICIAVLYEKYSMNWSLKYSVFFQTQVPLLIKDAGRNQNKELNHVEHVNKMYKLSSPNSLILGAFVTCWTPYHVLAIMAGFAPSYVNIHVYMFSYFLCYANR